jgi:hypothetical protein
MTSSAAALAENPEVRGYVYDMPHPDDFKVKRNRGLRALSVTLTTTAMIGVPALLGMHFASTFTPLFPLAEAYGFIIGMMAGFAGLAKISHRLFVYNDEWKGYVTQNAFSSDMIIYGPGLSASYPWEERNAENEYSLKTVTRTRFVEVETKTGKVIVQYTFIYARDLYLLGNAIGASESTVENGYDGFISSFVTGEVSDLDTERARTCTRELNQKLSDNFMDVRDDTTDETPADFEKNFGIRTVGIVISKIILPVEIEKVRAAVDEGRTLFEVVAALLNLDKEKLQQKLEDKTYTAEFYQKMLDRAMAISENAKLEIQAIEASGIGGSLLGLMRGAKAASGDGHSGAKSGH